MRYQVMLAKVGSIKLLNEKRWIFEPKLDGTRVLIYKNSRIKLINRRGRDITKRYPELNIKDNIKAKNCVLDGELVILDKKGKPNFNLLQEREQIDNEMLIKARSEVMPATIFVFDILELNGKSLVNKPFLQRKKKLEKIIINNPYIVLCPFTSRGKSLWKQVKSQGLEGIMAKRKGSVYEQGKRSEDWLKIKNLNTIDAVIVGFTKGEGEREKTFGSLVLAVYKGKKLIYIGRVGTGFNEKTLKSLASKMKKLITKKSPLEEKRIANVVWIKPKLIAEVKYLKLTKTNELRAPSFLSLRSDKKVSECILEEKVK